MNTIFDNKIRKVGDDLKNSIRKNSKLSIAAGIFSIYGFDALKKELKNIKELKFIFTDPTFIETNKKEQRFFEIQSNLRKKFINGSDFEINLKNKLNGKAIAKKCKRWIENRVTIKTNTGKGYIQPQFIIDNKDEKISYMGINEFSSAGFGYEKDNTIINYIQKITDYSTVQSFLELFNGVWNDKNLLKDITDDVVEYVSNLYKENSPEYIYYIILYHIFNEFLEDINEEELANDKTGFKNSVIWNKMYDFQKDAMLAIVNKLEQYNGCILADSVGLGKTFTALGVIKYYQERNKSILLLVPKKLGDNWQTFKNNYADNPLIKDRFNYDILYHTDLSRDKGISGEIDLSRINWGNYDLVVIDESHNFRNNDPRKDKETRYQRLLNRVIKSGVKTKVLMLSATPVNNKFTDLKNQIALAYEGKTNEIDEKINPTKSIDTILRNAQRIFNDWSKLPEEKKTSKELLKRLNNNFDFFKLLDGITIARSRKHIEKYYDIEKIGKFPNRLKPITKRTEITDLDNFMSIREIYKKLSQLNMLIYSPFDFILPNRVKFYEELYDTKLGNNTKLKQATREQNLKNLMRVNLLKRLESSVEAFRITLEKFIRNITATINAIDNFEKNGKESSVNFSDINNINDDDNDFAEELLDNNFTIGGKVKIKLSDMDTLSWKRELESDLEIAKMLFTEMQKITPKYDKKLQELKNIIKEKLEKPINEENKKILIFSAFADTVNYLYKHLSKYDKEELGLETAKVLGSGANDSTLNINKQFNNILINFSPKSKNRPNSLKNEKEIDILIATDCISEGQNLQDADMLVNYDIHWNPVRIIQRFGRIDRIGSQNKDIQLINFWPQLSLDDYINLKKRVEDRMFMVDATATGEDNVLTNKSSDLIFRKKQLEKLQEEIIDIEDMDSGISITDLGLNDFRMDLIEYINKNGDLRDVPTGMHAVCKKNEEKGISKGVIYILQNRNNSVNTYNLNPLHPFYLVYIKEDGEILSSHINVKITLDILRSISKGKNEPIKDVYEIFNEETDDGNKMEKYSDLLNQAIESIINIKEESDVDSLFSTGGTTALVNDIKGLEDFELIAFMVIK